MILFVPSTIFQLYRGRSSWIEPVLSYDKCVVLKDHNAVTSVKLEAAAHMSRVKHSTTEPLCSQRGSDVFLGKLYNFPRFQRRFNILRGGGVHLIPGGGEMHRNLSKLGFSMQGVQCRGPRPSTPPPSGSTHVRPSLTSSLVPVIDLHI